MDFGKRMNLENELTNSTLNNALETYEKTRNRVKRTIVTTKYDSPAFFEAVFELFKAGEALFETIKGHHDRVHDQIQ